MARRHRRRRATRCTSSPKAHARSCSSAPAVRASAARRSPSSAAGAFPATTSMAARRARARASTTISTPARSSSASPASTSRPRASSSSRSPAARPRRWCRSLPPSTPCARRAWPSASPSCSSPSPSPRRKATTNGLRALCEAFSIPTLDHDPEYRRPLLRPHQCRAACRRWRAGSMSVALREGAHSVIDVHARTPRAQATSPRPSARASPSASPRNAASAPM